MKKLIPSLLLTGCTLIQSPPPVLQCEDRPVRQEVIGKYTRNRWVQYTCVPVREKTTSEDVAGGFIPIYSVEVQSNGRPIHLVGQFEVTNDTNDNVGVGWGIRSGNRWICPPVMENLDRQRHHHPRQCVAIDLSPGTGKVEYVLTVYAKLMSAGGSIRVEPEYGYLMAWED